jgi:hypothetical protein
MSVRVHTARKPWCLMDGNEIEIGQASLHIPAAALSVCCVALKRNPITISQHCLPASSLSLPSPVTHSLLSSSPPHTKHVRHSPAKQFTRLQSCVLSLENFFLLSLSHIRHPHNQGPLTQNVKRSLNITNPNPDPVSFKIKTTAPKVCPPYV